MQRFEFNDGKSHKFWQVEQDGNSVTVCYGKVGSAGQGQRKEHGDAASARAALLKLVKEKTAKGYVGIDSAGTPADQAAPAMTASPAAPPAPSGIPPWPIQGDPLRLPAALMVAALPTRTAPRPIGARTADACWAEFMRGHAWYASVAADPSAPHLAPAAEEANRRLAGTGGDGSAASDALLMAVAAARSTRVDEAQASAFTDFLVASRGLPYALGILLDAQRLGTTSAWHEPSASQRICVHEQVDAVLAVNHRGYSRAEIRFRDHLALAEPALWDACAATMVAQAASLSPWRRPLLGMLLPDLPAFSEQMAQELGQPDSPPSVLALYASVRSEAALAALARLAPHHDDMLAFLLSPWLAPTIVRALGLRALDILAPVQAYDEVSDYFVHAGTPAAITALVRDCGNNKTALKRVKQAFERAPLAAIAALAELAAGKGKDAGRHASSLAVLLHAHPHALPSIAPWLSPAAQAAIGRIASRHTATPELAGHADLPRVLANPPWLAARKKPVAALDLAPLPLAVRELWAASERAEYLNDDWVQRILREPLAPNSLVRKLGFDERGTRGIDTDAFAARAVQAIAAHDAAAFSASWRDYVDSGAHRYTFLNAAYLAHLPAPMGLAVWNTLGGEDGYAADFAQAHFGLAGLPGLLAALRQRPNEVMGCAARVAAVEMAAPIARAYLKMKTSRAAAQAWLLAHPEHAACGLVAAALGKAGEARECAASALRMLARQGHEALLMAVAARYGRTDVEAAMRAMLDEDPLDLHPKKIGAAPAFWTPANWTRPVLAGNGKALPDAALEHLGAMLRFPNSEGVYPGIVQVRDACERHSLGAFMWDAFNAWTAAGAPSKESWVMAGLGLLGDDHTARELTRFIRSWPGEGQHARAVSGLDALAAIGSDTALMLLNGIAQKVKFKTLQDRAREKIQQVALARAMSPEELDDRLAPDLGLDAQGGIDLDFGPRQFRAGFDEALKPYVHDQDGARLPDLPKPRQNDDAALAAAALERFKLLKKDARTIAAQQVLRLELAMCAQRRWPLAVFEPCLVRHPLIGHLARRIVWGVYRATADARHGGTLLACFRIAADGTFTDAADAPFSMPPGAMVGIAHALDMTPPALTAFAQLLADYEILQPFRQLGRDTHAVAAEELAAAAFKRWDGMIVDSARLRGLAGRGWRRGDAQDGGMITHLSKELGQGRLIELHFTPGIQVGMGEVSRQTLGELRTGSAGRWGPIEKAEPFSTLDPVHASEMVRDIDGLCA
jgi:predicted DNA-binding WGR domain protein